MPNAVNHSMEPTSVPAQCSQPDHNDDPDRQPTQEHELPPHDVNGEDAALVPGEKIIDEIADDRVRFVAADSAAPSMARKASERRISHPTFARFAMLSILRGADAAQEGMFTFRRVAVRAGVFALPVSEATF